MVRFVKWDGVDVCFFSPLLFSPALQVPILMNLADAGSPALNHDNQMLPLENYGVKCMSMG